MEPTLPTPHGSPEMGSPQIPVGPEAAPRATPEAQPMPERPAPEEKRQAYDGDGTHVAAPTNPVVAPPQAQPQPAPVEPVDDNPLVAADEDLIEKEWVDKAKKIIADTKHDPYEQERAINRLQADYQKKRYGREVKIASEG